MPGPSVQNCCRDKSGLILLENAFDIGEVATINYAASIDADVVIVPEVQREEIQSLPRQLQAWAKDRSSPALRETRKKITDRIKGLDFTTTYQCSPLH